MPVKIQSSDSSARFIQPLATGLIRFYFSEMHVTLKLHIYTRGYSIHRKQNSVSLFVHVARVWNSGKSKAINYAACEYLHQKKLLQQTTEYHYEYLLLQVSQFHIMEISKMAMVITMADGKGKLLSLFMIALPELFPSMDSERNSLQ